MVQLNIRAITNKEAMMKRYVHSVDPNIICLNETRVEWKKNKYWSFHSEQA